MRIKVLELRAPLACPRSSRFGRTEVGRGEGSLEVRGEGQELI